MQHLHYAEKAGNGTFVNDEALSSGGTEGLKDYEYQHTDFNDSTSNAQLLDEIPNAFNRLARQFKNHGFGLYPLSGDSVLVSSLTLGMSRAFPDVRSAQMYLRQIGGRNVL